MPLVRVPDRFEATRDKARRHNRGDLGVERDLLLARIPQAANTLWERGFEDNGVRRGIGCAIVHQVQPHDVREQR